jgi:hypothetical protein
MKIKTQYKTLLFFAGVICLISSCDVFKYSMEGGEIPGETFSIENFENTAPLGNPAVSIWVQDLLRNRLLKETKLKYKPEDGDAHFTGTISSYSITPVVGTTAGATVDLNRLTISLKVSYTNGVDEKNDFSKTFTDYYEYDSSEDISTKEQELIELIGEKLIAQVFNDVLVDW